MMAADLERDRLFRDIDAYDWLLGAAYARAAVPNIVPAILKGLVDDSARAREEARLAAMEALWHQGTIYEATGHAVPFLVRLLAFTDDDGVDHITFLLALFALSARGALAGRAGCGSVADGQRIHGALEGAGPGTLVLLGRADGLARSARENLLVALMQVPALAQAASAAVAASPDLADLAARLRAASYDEVWDIFENLP
jgi:hypothetical protein